MNHLFYFALLILIVVVASEPSRVGEWSAKAYSQYLYNMQIEANRNVLIERAWGDSKCRN